MFKFNNRYKLGTENFFNQNNSNLPPETPFCDSESETSLSRFEISQILQQPTLLHTTQYTDLFISNKEGLNMPTGI